MKFFTAPIPKILLIVLISNVPKNATQRKLVNGIEFSVENAPKLYHSQPSILLPVV